MSRWGAYATQSILNSIFLHPASAAFALAALTISLTGRMDPSRLDVAVKAMMRVFEVMRGRRSST
jgi:hypothetical protein